MRRYLKDKAKKLSHVKFIYWMKIDYSSLMIYDFIIFYEYFPIN